MSYDGSPNAAGQDSQHDPTINGQSLSDWDEEWTRLAAAEPPLFLKKVLEKKRKKPKRQ